MRAAEWNAYLASGVDAVWSHEAELTDQLEALLRKIAQEAALGFESHVTRFSLDASAGVTPAMTMIAVYPTPEQQNALAGDGEGAQEASTIHCTLSFIGELSETQYDALVAAVKASVGSYGGGSLDGTVGGVACFAKGPEGHPSILLPDVKGLAELRHHVVMAAEQAGFASPSEHGWTPHLTHSYSDDPTTPPITLCGEPLTFDRVSVTRGDVMRTDVLLDSGATVITAAGVQPQPKWVPPHPDEVLNATKLGDKINMLAGGYREAAVSGFGSKLPTCLVPAGNKSWGDAWAKKLTDGEKEAITQYRSSTDATHYRNINKLARGGKIASKSERANVANSIANLDRAIAKSAVPKSMTVYRGVADVYKVLKDLSGEFDDLPGKTFHDLGFVSTSTSKAIATQFSGDDFKGALFRITLPKGTQAAFIDKAGYAGRVVKEREVLLPRGTEFKITKVTYDRKGDPILDVEVVKSGGKSIRGAAGGAAGGTGAADPDTGAVDAGAAGGGQGLTAAGGCGPGEVALKWDVTSPFYKGVLARTGEHIGAISDNVRVDVMKVIDRAYIDGLSVRDTGSLIRETMEGTSRGWAETIARTELNRVANGASLDATRTVDSLLGGGQFMKEWMTAPGAPHPRHELDAGLDGQTVGLEEFFNVNGEPLMFPGDPDGDPGETINCRCTLVYVDAQGDETMAAEEDLSLSGAAEAAEVASLQADMEVPMGTEAETETLDADDGMGACTCEHSYDTHEGDGGACSMDDCSCTKYDEAEAVVADAAVEVTPPEQPIVGGAIRWQAVLLPEGKATDDGRVFAPGSVSWRDVPLTLMGLIVTEPEGHEGAQLCGRIDRIWKDESVTPTLVRAEGIFDPGEYGSEIARMVGEETLRGNSVDVAIREYEIGVRSAYVDADGMWIAGDGEVEGPALEDMLFGDEPLMLVVRDAVIGMSTVCPFPAFEEGQISVMASADANGLVAESHNVAVTLDVTTLRWHVWIDDSFELVDGLTASAAGMVPETPPAAWFDDPEFEEPTPVTVTDDGRVFGHAWTWDTCHIGLPGCTTAPHSITDYAFFHLKECQVENEDGTTGTVEVGTITLDAPHAEQHASRKEATAHYDNTGCAVADIRVGEDEHGGWVAGALRPDASAATVRKLRGAVLSGDWRKQRGNLELVGLLAVNIPGFPVPRARASVLASANGEAEVVSLVAAGINHATVTAADRHRFAALSARASGGMEALAALAIGTPVEEEDCGCGS